MTQTSGGKSECEAHSTPHFSRRGLATAICGGTLIAMLSGRETMARRVPNPARIRLQRVGKLMTERGLSLRTRVQFEINTSPGFKGVLATNTMVLVSQNAIELCENDGQLAAILGYYMLALPTRGAGSPLTKTAPQATERAAASGIIRALARVGYDPRDGLAIWQKMQQNRSDTRVATDMLLEIMGSELRMMGYVV